MQNEPRAIYESENSRLATHNSQLPQYMTTVRPLHRVDSGRRRVEGKLRWAVLCGLACVASAAAQGDGPVHWRHAGAMPPGAIGRLRLMRGGPLSGYCQPVEIRAPQGARIAPAVGPSFGEPRPDKLLVGLAIGPVYRFRVTDIPEHPEIEVFPTVEMVDRTYPPPGESLKFPVPIDLTREELLMAAEGKFVTRVIYIEDPQLALPVAEKAGSDTRWFDVRAGEDPLITADSQGRPIAILRLGARLPDSSGPDCAFVYGAPPAIVFDRQNSVPGEVQTLPYEELAPPAQLAPGQ